MNNWIYLILIAVLAILALVMLYSRFAARSREKSFHHSPARIMFSAATISAAPLDEREASAITSRGEEEFSLPQIKSDPVEETTTESPGAKRSKNPESDYLDELQEAAAGLALLMRSSPVGRVAPVVFAPDGTEDSAEGESSIHAVDESTSEDPSAHEVTVTPATTGLDQTPEPVEERIVPSREVLGELVFEIVDRIDLELEALENLVMGIEMSLLALAVPGYREGGEGSASEEGNRVSEAA